MQRYETAFYARPLSDWRNFETWSDQGAVDATQRVNGIWKQLLAEYEQPPLPSAVDAELEAFVAHRKEQYAAR